MQREMAPLRRLGLHLLSQGASQAELMRELGVSRTTAWKWAGALQGGEALVAQASAPRLDGLQRSRLRLVMKRGACACGFPTDGWTMARLAVMIELEFGLACSPVQVFYLLGEEVPQPASVGRFMPSRTGGKPAASHVQVHELSFALS